MARLLSIEYPGFEKLNFFGGTTRRIHLGFDTAADVMYLNKVAYKKLTNIVSIFASLMLVNSPYWNPHVIIIKCPILDNVDFFWCAHIDFVSTTPPPEGRHFASEFHGKFPILMWCQGAKHYMMSPPLVWTHVMWFFELISFFNNSLWFCFLKFKNQSTPDSFCAKIILIIIINLINLHLKNTISQNFLFFGCWTT